MATPMRSSSQDAGHRARVADSRNTAKADTQASNFEYDDNEWDIGIGDLIIDLDADIEKTNEGAGVGSAMATNASPASSGKTAAKLAIEHSATVDKGLKMKIKRTKPGTKTSEAKHEIVKSNELNGNVDGQVDMKPGSKHPVPVSNSAIPGSNNATTGGGSGGGGGGGNSKRGSSGHRRDKARDKHSGGGGGGGGAGSGGGGSEKPAPTKVNASSAVTVTEVNGIVRVSAPQPGPQRSIFPASTGPGPPIVQAPGPVPGPPPSPAAATAQGSAAKPEQAKIAASVLQNSASSEDNSSSPPPNKKLKTEPKVSPLTILFNQFNSKNL